MNRAITSILLTGVMGLLLVSCGGGGNNNTTTKTSGIKTRAFVSNSANGYIEIIDYAKQIQTGFGISAGSGAGMMVLTPDKASTLIVDSAGGQNAISIIDNKTEKALATVMIPAPTNSVVVSPDSKTAWVATRNAPATDSGGNVLQTGAVQVVDLTKQTLGTQIPVALAQTLALSPDGKKLLVFRDQTDTASFIDLSVTTPAAVNVTGSAMSRPAGAVFSSDGTKAYVVNCGPECGGTGSAGVSVLDMTTTPPTAGAVFPLDAADIIFADTSNNLYVAGTKPGSASGSLTVLTASGGTLSISKAPITIGGGFHTQIISASNNKLFIGAVTCSDTAGLANAGCLTIYDTGTSTATITKGGQGVVTGMAAVPVKNMVYVVTGGELLTYDTTTSDIFAGPCQSSCFIDIVGKAEDVKVIE